MNHALLIHEASSMTTDLAGWLSVNFTLSTKQNLYLASLPPIVLQGWGSVIAGGVLGRSVITMLTPPTDYGPPRRTKKTKVYICGELSYFPPVSGTGPLESTLTVEISYELVD